MTDASRLPDDDRPIHVLVVDDIGANLRLLDAVLAPRGFVVDTADSGPAALERLQELDVDVVLLDVNMPGMTGYELAAKLAKHPVTRRAKVIAVTGYGQPGDTEPAKAAGFAGYLVKPVDLAQLRERITSILGTQPSRAGR